jgi:prepilin peptidase CpaA
LLAGAIVTDLRARRIPNRLVACGLLLALAAHTAAWAAAPASASALDAAIAPLAGLAMAGAVLLPLYLLGACGAGDVKLMAMVGAFLGVSGTLAAILFTFIAGGIAALAFALWHRAIGRMAGNVRDIVQSMAFAAFAGIRPTAANAGAASIGRLPYAISICVGTIASLAVTQLGFA